MIIAEFIKSEEKFLGFKISGHAGYAQAGEDICCAAVSSAVMMTYNMVTEIFAVDAEVSAEENKIMLFLSQKEDENGEKLIKGLAMQLECIAEEFPGSIEIRTGGAGKGLSGT